MSSQNSISSTFKSTTVSIPDDSIVITHTSPQPQFTNLIETEKCLLLHDSSEREHTNEPVVVVTNDFTDDDEFECDSEINRITNYRGGRNLSPEPSEHELSGLRINVSFDEGVECTEGVEFEEFCVGDKNNVSSKSSSKTKQMYSKSSVQSQSSVEKTCKTEAVSMVTEASVLESGQKSVSLETQQVSSVEEVEQVAMVNKGEEDVKEKKKIERKSSKAGKKNKNAEISKENISVKSSFSKFDSLVSKNSNGAVAVENKESTSEPNESIATKPEAKKMYCASCEKQVFQMELIRAEKKDWHKNCFRCVSCRKVLSVDTYQSHEQRLYCKPHFKELFQPKAVVDEGTEENQDNRSSDKRSKLQLIICESQPKELPPDVVRASDTPSTGLEDIQIDVRSKFELFEGLKKCEDETGVEVPVVKRSASVLAKLKKYENSLANGNTELEGVSDEDLHGVDGIELQSDEEVGGYEENSCIKDEIKRKLKNPLQALNEIAHFKQMEQVRSKWEEGTFTRDQLNAESRKEELQKFRSRLCQGKSGQLKELYEKGVENGGEVSDSRVKELEELSSEKAKGLREMFERGEVIKGEDEDGEKRKGGVDLEVFEAGVARESKRLFEELDKRVCVEEKEVKRGGRFVKKLEKDYDTIDGDNTYRDPTVVRHGESEQDDTLVKSKTTSKMLSVFRQMEENLSRESKDPIIRPLKQFTPPRDTIGRNVVDSEEEESEVEEEEEEEVDEEDVKREDEFLKEVGSLARARSLRAKFERWEQQENERNKTVPDELAESIESAKNLKAKFEAMRLMGDGGNKENGGGRGVPIKVNRFVLNTNNLNSSSSSTSTSPQQLTQFCAFNSLPSDVSNHSNMSSGGENCAACEKRVYVMEKVEAGGKMYHKNCFKCSHCKCILRMGNFTSNKGQLYCKPHMIQLFKVKGNYDEGFGHETQYQQWAKNKQAQQQA